MKPGSRFGTAHRPSGSIILLAACLILGSLLLTFSPAARATSGIPEHDVPGSAERALFVKGQNLYNQGLYHEAIAVFGDFLSGYPQSQIKDLALLWLGRCHVRIGEVRAAEQIGVRLRGIPDTQLVSLYEEELRVARRSYPKASIHPALVAAAPASEGRLRGLLPEAKATISVASANVEIKNSVSGRIGSNEPAKVKQTGVVKPPLTVQQTKAPSLTHDSPKTFSNTGPSVRIRMEQSPRESTVGGVTFYRLVIVNEGKGVARDLIVSEILTRDVQFASSDPAPSRQEPVGHSQRLTFRIDELKSGASRTLRIAVRLRAGAGPEAFLKTKHSLTYQDSDKKSYEN